MIRTSCILILAASLVVTSAITSSPVAVAGEYVVDGTCSAWTSFDNQPNRLASYPECPHLRARNVLGNFSTPRNPAGAGWRFDAPAGTAIRAADLDAYITGGKSWWSEVKVVGSPSQPYGYLANCFGKDDCGAHTVPGQFPDLNGSVIATVWCEDKGGCPNSGSNPRGSIDIFSSRITLFDPSPPAVSIAGGPLSGPGWHGGQTQLVVSASDNTGIRAARALIDGDARHSTTNGLPCDYGHPVPCSNQTATVDVDLRGVPDGQHALEGQADDAAGNAGNSGAQTISVDNTPPLAPVGAHLTGGPSWRASNNFTVVWNNPAEAYAPIAGVGYRLCPQGLPDGSPQCKDGNLASPDISRLAFQVPGPGAWRMRLWLVDAAGNGTPTNGVTINGLGLLARREGRVASHLRVGRKSHHRLARRTTVGLGHRVKLVGRLSVGRHRKGLHRTLLVYRRVSVQGARFKPAGRVRTGRRGRFVFHAKAGPSRRLLFVYPGGGNLAGKLATVNLNVSAKLRIRADRRRLHNGETVTLSGRLRGGHIPPGGALLELQVYTRGSWRPFATPRTDPQGGWSYGYRFETVTGTAHFRFRAKLRKQPTYPYIAKSRAIGVRVQGQ